MKELLSGSIDPISEYGNDYFTVPSSIAGAPGLNIPIDGSN